MLIKPISAAQLETFRSRLNRLYGSRRTEQCIERLTALIGRYGVGYSPEKKYPLWSEKSAVLITYADTIRCEGEKPLETLRKFASARLKDAFSAIHILPFFPWSSDDGFSVIDYRRVDPALGRWEEVQELAASFDLMFDLVLNHASRKSAWFKNYIAGFAPYRDYFIESDPDADLSAVVRPRSLPLLTAIRRNGVEKHLWTTFSDDQIDLNFSNPDVLFEFLDILLFYIANGATMIRLDAVAYLWKQPGTPCIHLEQTHETVRLLRDLLNAAAPNVLLLTETNVPHTENISYFGSGDEAHMVYPFSLPPLLLHALQTGKTRYLTVWAKTVCETPPGCTWFNFTASHDGIGVRPLVGLIPESEVAFLVQRVKDLGGQVSTRRNADGTDSPYELNITWFSAMGDDAFQADRFLCSQTVLLGLKGIPALYIHSLTATPNDLEGVQATGQPRSINRKKWNLSELELLLTGENTTAAMFRELIRRLGIRRRNPAFHPDAAQRIVDAGDSLFAFVRIAGSGETVACIHNLSATEQKLTLDPQLVPECSGSVPCTDLLSGTRYSGENKRLILAPFQTVWLSP